MVRNHHERWDGNGLPDRLCGEEIPLEARIAAVADTFDAMTSHRPYRPQLPIAATVEEMLGYAGAQFDTHILDRFVTVVERGELQGIAEVT